MTINFKKLDIPDYEEVYEITDDTISLHAIISIHHSHHNCALGGTRLYPYDSFESALQDALRLSKTMTYKNALIDNPCGGGKGVIIYKAGLDKTALLQGYAEAVEQLGGRFITAEDVGVGPEEVLVMSQKTRYLVGLKLPGKSGDPARFTSFGVMLAMKAACLNLFGTTSLRNKTVAILGLGAVGGHLAAHLFWAGANLIVADLDEEKVASVVKEWGAKAVSPNEIHAVECDIFSPNAMGGTLNAKTIPELKAKMVIGGANNQLAKEGDAEMLHERSIVYVPDYLVNAGGLINVSFDLQQEAYSPLLARNKVFTLFDLIYEVLSLSTSLNLVAHKLVSEITQEKLSKWEMQAR